MIFSWPDAKLAPGHQHASMKLTSSRSFCQITYFIHVCAFSVQVFCAHIYIYINTKVKILTHDIDKGADALMPKDTGSAASVMLTSQSITCQITYFEWGTHSMHMMRTLNADTWRYVNNNWHRIGICSLLLILTALQFNMSTEQNGCFPKLSAQLVAVLVNGDARSNIIQSIMLW